MCEEDQIALSKSIIQYENTWKDKNTFDLRAPNIVYNGFEVTPQNLSIHL